MAVAEVFRSSRDRHFDAAVEKLRVGVQAMAAWVGDAEAEGLGEALIQIREVGIDPLEAVFATGVRRFDKSGEYKADGALSLTAWLRWKCKLSGGAALERVEVARQLEKLPKTTAAFANGDVGFQHVAVLARTAEHVGAAAVRKEEGTLLQAAQTMDPGQFVTVAKNFEHRVDAAGALAEANHAYQRRYFHIGEPVDGLVRVDGLLDAEGGATLRTALQPFMKPVKDDARNYGQRSIDALMELCRQGSGSRRDGAGPRPQLIIRASLDTLAGTKGAPAGELEGGGTVRPTLRLRLGDQPDHGPGRAGARAQSRQPDLAGANPARARVARPALRLPGLHQTTELVRRAPPRVVDARRRDGAAQPRDALPAASPHGPRRRLVPRAREG